MKTQIKDKAKSPTPIPTLIFTKCRSCGCKELIRFEVDTFCTSCDWNSILMDVDCGNFEKRIAINLRADEQQHSTLPAAKIIEASFLFDEDVVA